MAHDEIPRAPDSDGLAGRALCREFRWQLTMLAIGFCIGSSLVWWFLLTYLGGC